MITAKAANILSGEYNEQFNALSNEIKELALKKYHDKNIDFSRPPYQWIEKLGFELFKEVMASFGYKVYNNNNSYKISW